MSHRPAGLPHPHRDDRRLRAVSESWTDRPSSSLRAWPSLIRLDRIGFLGRGRVLIRSPTLTPPPTLSMGRSWGPPRGGASQPMDRRQRRQEDRRPDERGQGRWESPQRHDRRLRRRTDSYSARPTTSSPARPSSPRSRTSPGGIPRRERHPHLALHDRYTYKETTF